MPPDSSSVEPLQSLRARIADYLAESGERNIEFLRRLLAIPKPRMQEHQAVRFCADALAEAGCEVDVFAGEGIAEPTPAGAPINVLASRRGSGVGGGSGGGRSLLLEAHLDTVPPGSRERWSYDPWGATVVGDRVYARGAQDDVAGAALICLVARSLAQLQLSFAGDLYFLLTTEEEYSSGGMRALLKRRPDLRPDAHLLVDGNGEPSDCIVGHPGSVSFTIRIPGPFGSAQSPAHVHHANPIEFASKLIDALRRLEDEIGNAPSPPVHGLNWPKPTIAIVGIESVGWISNVPERCDFKAWGNVIPPMTIVEYRVAVTSCIQGEASADPWFRENPPQIIWGPIDVPAMVTSMDSPFYRALGAAHAEVFGNTLRPRLIGGWGDMRLLGCDQALFYGPGGGGNCHGYDEYYRISDLNPMLRSLLYLCADWCGMQ